MRLLERVLVVLALSGGSALADPIDMKPFRASYTAEWKGIAAADSKLELRRAGGDTYEYETVNTPRGVFRMALPDSLSQASTFRITDGRVVPLSYRGSDEKERPVDLPFDWERKRVTGIAKGQPVDRELPANAQDPMSLQIAIAATISRAATCRTPSGWWTATARSRNTKLRPGRQPQIDTALGELDTIIYTSKRAGSDRLYAHAGWRRRSAIYP